MRFRKSYLPEPAPSFSLLVQFAKLGCAGMIWVSTKSGHHMACSSYANPATTRAVNAHKKNESGVSDMRLLVASIALPAAPRSLESRRPQVEKGFKYR